MNREYGINAENLLRSVPDALKTGEVMSAIVSLSAGALASRLDEIEGMKIYTRIDELPEALLDILAYDFRVDWWDPNYSIEEKRQTLKDSWGVHRKLGTKAAVVRAISAIFKDTELIEWFEYGGPPYQFKLLIDATYENADPVKYQRVLDRLDYYKNLRSSPFLVEYTAYPQGSCTTYAGVAAVCMSVELTVGVDIYGLG